ncbi:N5-carboxyaminoimidazole ribonucleotide synthase [Tistrella bauzanensis]|uniref:N5-carboxyaminoimidazole ribonucleotide synthase n=1 Tax=Tistrella bauzanensis TaxID=657419 RepID=A0ABQ1IBI1_9PROT|nr:5-(carboxyamino)imidazole ribonucleotide synthase [Tistrella bauzanensis]GGB29216.1 N5-carboxyaminoimidazole ribonucleotide synthase [Tistrella bauzanensis]
MTQPAATATARPSPLKPGSVIGIMGGGQLGRMAAMAAARMGYKVHIYAPEAESPAAEVADARTRAAWDDEAALAAFAEAVDVVTFEFENVPAASVARLAGRRPVRPSWTVLESTQDRLTEKDLVNRLGIGTAPYARVDDLDGLVAAIGALGRPAILKTRTLGYDGKGQARIGADGDFLAAAEAAFATIAGAPAILEGMVDFTCEISVIVARSPSGAVRCFEPAENSHRDGILHISRVPARISPAIAAEAERVARMLAEAMGLEGLLAVEMFVTRDGRVLVNEMAPRPHNSGHWSFDAAATSQFEQFIRAVADLPLGDPSRLVDARMENLIGDDIERWQAILAEPRAKLHLYGKSEAKPGRKMGHVTRLGTAAVTPVSGDGSGA